MKNTKTQWLCRGSHFVPTHLESVPKPLDCTLLQGSVNEGKNIINKMLT